MNVALSKSRPTDTQPGAVAGQDRAEQTRRSNDRVSSRMNSSGEVGTFPDTKKRFVPANEHSAAQEFSAVIIPYTRGELARAAKRSKESAKAWKEGRSLPSAWSLFNMAQEIPAVKAWMCAMLGLQQKPEILSDQVMTAMMAALQQVAQQGGPGADAVRAMFQQGSVEHG